MSEFDPNNYPKKPSRLDIIKNRLARGIDLKKAGNSDLRDNKYNTFIRSGKEGRELDNARSNLYDEQSDDTSRLEAISGPVGDMINKLDEEGLSPNYNNINMPEDEITTEDRMQALRKRFGAKK